MDLVRIFHVVDMPSSGKHGFNYIHVVGLIHFILIQFILILLSVLSNVHVLVGLLSHEYWLLLSFSYCGFFSDPSCCPVFRICMPPMWSSMDDHGVD